MNTLPCFGFPRLLIVLALWLPMQSSAIGWVSRHGMTPSAYQAEFNTWTQPPHSYRLISVAGNESDRDARYTAIWADESGPAWRTHPGMTQSGYEAIAADYALENYYPVFLSGFSVAGQARYNAIWHHLPGVDIVGRVGLTHSMYLAEQSSRTRAGYTLVHLWTFNVGNTELFTAVWRRGVTTEHQPVLQLSSSQHQANFEELGAKGFQMIAVSASVINGAARYTSLWKQNTTGVAWATHHGLTGMNYQAETWNWEYQGYRPVIASVSDTATGPRYNFIVVRNGGMLPEHLKAINDAMSFYMKSNNVPGLSLAFSHNGRLLYAKGFGQADKAADESVHPHHRFRIASVSKPITAAAILKLQQHCRLRLGDRVFGPGSLLGNAYGTPPYSAREQSLTVTQLLQHTTGWSTDGIWQVGGASPATAIDWQLDNANGEPSVQPGTRWEYMNIGFAVAGRIIEKLSGKTYERFVQDELLAPSCITQMEIGGEDPEDRKPFEVVYYENSTDNYDPYDLSPSRMDAHGGWIARPIDLLLFQRRFDRDTVQADIIGDRQMEDMRFSPDVPNSDGNAVSYGLGLGVGNAAWGHNGAMSGTMSLLEYRADGYAFALTGNLWPDKRDDRDRFLITIKQLVNNLIDDLDAANAWPNYDLFPCQVAPGEAPKFMEDPRTFYVDNSAGFCLTGNGLSPTCMFPFFGGPFFQVIQAFSAGCSGDRLMVRGGVYPESLSYDRPMIIESYNGVAVIGQ